MSETSAAADLYSAIEISAGLLDLPCSHEKVWPILEAYEESLPNAVIAFRVGTGTRYTGDVDWRFAVPRDTDPYAVALEAGLTAATDHPCSSLLANLRERCPIDSYGVDFGVVGGFRKIYSVFDPNEMQKLSTLADIPSMPPSLTENLGFFTRYGLDGDKVNIFAIDYRSRTINIYFAGFPDQNREPETIRSMLHETGFPEPSEKMLTIGQQGFGMYVTLGWDSPKIERFSLSMMTPNSRSLPIPIESKIGRFLDSVLHDSADPRFVYCAYLTPGGEEHFKVQAYHKWHSRMQRQMLLSDSAGQQGN